MTPDVFLAVICSYLMVAMLGFALGHLNAELAHRRDREIDSWPTLPGLVDPWAEPASAYDWAREGTA